MIGMRKNATIAQMMRSPMPIERVVFDVIV